MEASMLGRVSSFASAARSNYSASNNSSDSEDDGSVFSGSVGEKPRRYEDQDLTPKGILAPGAGYFSFINPNTLKDITVFYIKSRKYRKAKPPVFVFHGVFRNPDIYRDAWVDLAEDHGFFIVAPLFSEDQFPGSHGYNLGNIFVSETDRTPTAERNWSYHIPAVVFDFLVSKGDINAPGYMAYGHSAGSQYLHRKLAITPDPRLLLCIASNAGWYTMPTRVDLWPYGWGGFEEAGIPLQENFLADYLAAPLIVQLGKKDTDKKHKNLRRTPEAMAQGANRLERGMAFFNKGQQVAREFGFSFNWRLEFVEGVAHSSARMAPRAADYITEYIRVNMLKSGQWRHPPLPPPPEPILAEDECDVGPNAMQPLINFAICIHGGAGVISKSDSVSEQYTTALRDIIRRCHFFAKDDASRTAVDIAEFAVNLLENDPLFNAGIGAVFTADETHELEASIMEGTNLGCGASALLTNVKNPISLARKVMETGKHVWIAGNPGEEIAEREDLLLVESNEEFSVPRRLAQLERAKEKDGIFNDHDSAVAEEQKPGEEQKTSGDATTTTTATADSASLTEGGDIGGDKKEVFDNLDDEINTETVGCVVMRNGHLCAATSTGGMTNKCAGRIGDTPMIGCGTYANDKTCAVSATGKGEEFIRHIVAYDISARMEYCGSTLMEAAKATVFHRLPAESGGIIAVDPMGNTAMVFNSRGMFRASCNSNSEFTIGIWEEEVTWKEDSTLP